MFFSSKSDLPMYEPRMVTVGNDQLYLEMCNAAGNCQRFDTNLKQPSVNISQLSDRDREALRGEAGTFQMRWVDPQLLRENKFAPDRNTALQFCSKVDSNYVCQKWETQDLKGELLPIICEGSPNDSCLTREELDGIRSMYTDENKICFGDMCLDKTRGICFDKQCTLFSELPTDHICIGEGIDRVCVYKDRICNQDICLDQKAIETIVEGLVEDKLCIGNECLTRDQIYALENYG